MLAKILPRIDRITAVIDQWQSLHIVWHYSSAHVAYITLECCDHPRVDQEQGFSLQKPELSLLACTSALQQVPSTRDADVLHSPCGT